MTNPIKIVAVPTLKDNYVWILIDQDNHATLIVDPGVAQPVKDYLQHEKLNLVGILITHHHWDHTNGIHELTEHYHVPVYGPASISGVTEPVINRVSPKNFPLTFEVIAIPGHTLEHIAYYAPGMLFCGDTLFAAGCGRLFEGTAQQMFDSLQKLAALPADTKVYCAHEYTLNNLRFAAAVEPDNATIQEKIDRVSIGLEAGRISLPSSISDEKDTNPFLRCEAEEVIASASSSAGEQLSTPLEVFAALRQWKDKW